MKLVQQTDFLMIRKNPPWALDHVCSYSSGREEGSCNRPVDLPIGWGKMGSSDILAGWLGVYIALEGLGEKWATYLPSRGLRGPGCSKRGRWHYNEMVGW